jgi:hypothetical protein
MKPENKLYQGKDVKKGLEKAYDIGYKNALKEIKDIVKKVLIEIFNEWEIDDDIQKWVFEEIDKELLNSLGEK